MNNKIKEMYWRIRIFFLAIRWIPQINIGDIVVYEGKQYIVYNGVYRESWKLKELNRDYILRVPRKYCKKVFTLKNIKHSFYSGWNFYMRYWFRIWCQTGIEDWMLSCNIWPRK